jgi:hypothetical protein
VTVQHAITGTATNGIDYSAIGTNVTLNAGAASGQVLISPIDLSFAQPSETADLTILPNTNYSLNFTNGASDTLYPTGRGPNGLAACGNAISQRQPVLPSGWTEPFDRHANCF